MIDMNRDKIKIIVLGRNLEIINLIVRLVNNSPDWQAKGYIKDVNVIEAIKQEKFDLLLLASGITNEEESKLRENITEIDSNVKIIQHFGGGSGLLYNEIQTVLDENIPST